MSTSPTKAKARSNNSSKATSKVADKQRKIQKAQDEKDQRQRAKSAGKKSRTKAVQAGAVNYP